MDNQIYSHTNRSRKDSLSSIRDSQLSDGPWENKADVAPYEPRSFHSKFQSVEVHFPTAKVGLLFSHMVYRIDVLWEGEVREIFRRYSSVSALRDTIEAQLPFHLIFPVHHKQKLHKTEATFLSYRTSELNYFFRYLIFNAEKFHAIQPLLGIFFCTSYDDVIVLKRLGEFRETPLPSQLLPIYRQLTENCNFTVRRVTKRKELDGFYISLCNTILLFKVSSKGTARSYKTLYGTGK